ncbi:hypothetical protein J132_10500, partial [Termitomyces sp. J132]
DIVCPYLHAFEDVFFKASFNSLPECKQCDHAIELLPNSTSSTCKVYLLVPKGQDKLNTFLQENLDSNCICPSTLSSESKLRTINLPSEQPVIISGDWNQHHPMWSKGDAEPAGSNAEVYDTELVGIAQATKAATNYAKRKRQVRHVQIFADNMAAVTLAYRPKPMPGQLQMVKITHQVDTFLGEREDRSIGIEWCPGHEKVKGNEHADEEAKKGAELWAQDHTTLTNAKRKSREKALKKWRSEWKKTLPTGGFAIANRLCPRWKPREHVVNTTREVFGRLTQCHTKHAFIGEYYTKFIPREGKSCPCGERFQTREHIFRHAQNTKHTGRPRNTTGHKGWTESDCKVPGEIWSLHEDRHETTTDQETNRA